MRTLLKNAKIYDGSGDEPFMGNILIEGERISVVASEPSSEDADEIMDLGGLSLAPGFIDAHSHNDWFAIVDGPMRYFEPFIRQGITTFVTGNCGLSVVGFCGDVSNSKYVG